MADDFQDKLNAVLSNPEMMKTLSALAGSMGGSEKNLEKSDVDESTLMNIQNIVSAINDNSDSRINLLNALKPYMRKTRVENMDMAIRILKLTKLTSFIKDI